MKSFVVIILSLFVCTQGCAQTDSVYSHKGKSVIRYFDIEEFKRKSTTSSGYDCLEGGMRVSYLKRYDSKDKVIGYTEWREGINTPYGYYYEYDLRGRLIHSITPVRDKDPLRKVPIAYSFQCALAVPRAYSRRNSMQPMPHKDS